MSTTATSPDQKQAPDARPHEQDRARHRWTRDRLRPRRSRQSGDSHEAPTGRQQRLWGREGAGKVEGVQGLDGADVDTSGQDAGELVDNGAAGVEFVEDASSSELADVPRD